MAFPFMVLLNVAHTVSLLALVVYTETATPEHELFRRFWRPDREAFGTVFRLGWPIGITTVTFSRRIRGPCFWTKWVS